MGRNIVVILMAILVVLVVGNASAEIYKWRDAAGKLHFSDTPPVTGEQTGQADVFIPRGGSDVVDGGAEVVRGGGSVDVVDDAQIRYDRTMQELEVQNAQIRADNPEWSARQCEDARQKYSEVMDKIGGDSIKRTLYFFELTEAETRMSVVCPPAE